MAQIIGAIGTSHTPTIGFAFDTNKREDPAWKPIFEMFEPIAAVARRQEARRSVLSSSTITSPRSSSITIRLSRLASANRTRSPMKAAARAICRRSTDIRPRRSTSAQSLMADEFDMSFFQGKPLDHGLFSPLSVMMPHKPQWPAAIVPLQVGVLQFPIPTARRCYKLGQSLRKAIESYPEDLKVAIVATGGLSHQVHGERAGFNNPEWDDEFMDLLENDPERLAA